MHMNRGITLLYVIALVAGGLGGCAAASHYMLRNKEDSRPMAIYFIAYGVLGTFFGIGGFALHAFMGMPYNGPHQVVLFSLVYGFGGAAALAATNVSMKFLLRRLGIEVSVTVKQATGK